MLDFTTIRVLVTEAGGKQSVTMVRGLKEIGCHVTVVCSDKNATCYVSNKPDIKILDEHIADHNEKTLENLLALVQTGNYDVLMPIGEQGTNFVTQHEDELRQHVRLACAPRSAYINAFDKQRTFEIANRIGIPIPRTRMRGQTVEDYLSTVSFPLIIKPRNGLGSIGFHKFEKREDFEPYLEEHQINLDDYVLQEFVDYEKRLGTILFMDQKGNVCMAYADEVLRWFPIDAGTACLIRSIDHQEAIKWSSDLLREMKWQGIAALSFMIDRNSGVPKLLEINGRVPASIRLSYQCGFNPAKLLTQLAYGETVEQYPVNTRFGLMTRQFDLDLAWFLKSGKRFSAEPSWFSWRNTKEALFYRDDRRPFFANLFTKTIGYRRIMKKKQH